jgi:hypothetical protein
MEVLFSTFVPLENRQTAGHQQETGEHNRGPAGANVRLRFTAKTQQVRHDVRQSSHTQNPKEPGHVVPGQGEQLTAYHPSGTEPKNDGRFQAKECLKKLIRCTRGKRDFIRENKVKLS